MLRNLRKSIRLFLIIVTIFILPFMPNKSHGALDSKGRDFWIAFLENYQGSPALQLFITSEYDTQGSISIPGLSWIQDYSVTANQTTTVNIPSNVMLTGTGIQNKGIHIVADDEVSIYGLNQISASTDAFLSLPQDVSNFEYFIMAYKNLLNYGSEFAVVALHDDTTFNYWLPGQEAQTISLNQGEVYSYKQSDDITGTYIESNKTISVFSGVQCTNIPTGYYACDHIVEQMPALSTWGTTFYTIPLATRRKGDTFRIMAGMNETSVYINGTFVTRLGAGEFHEQIIDGTSVITTDNPCLVAQYSNGSTYDNVTSDPFMMIVPPIEQSLNSYTFSTPGSVFSANYVNVLVPDSIVGEISLDGDFVSSSLFTPIQGTNFSGAQIPVSVGSHTISASQNFGIHSYGFARYDSYGYPGGLAFEIINPGVITIFPTSFDFGTFGVYDIIDEVRSVTLRNSSDVKINIEEISILGQDATDFELVSINGTPVTGTTYKTPFLLWPNASMDISFKLSPLNIPTDSVYDASLSIIGLDENGYTAKTVASLSATIGADALVVEVLDASPTINYFDDGVPMDQEKNPVTESSIAEIEVNKDSKRTGIVTDGNSRLFLRAQTNSPSGYVTFNIVLPTQTGALLYDLENQSNNDEDGTLEIQVPVSLVDSSKGQATAVLRAAERFIAGADKEEINFSVVACYRATETGECLTTQTIKVREQRAPVVLMHGIWSNTTACWGDNNWPEEGDKIDGMLSALRSKYFKSEAYDYPGFNEDNDTEKNLKYGPSTTMLNDNPDLALFINGPNGICSQFIKQGFSCTRADLIGHSMGGLNARKFISNKYYKNSKNFNLGAVRRLVTISTPHYGSQLANMLLYDNEAINNCIEDEDSSTPDVIENKHIKQAIDHLGSWVNNYISTAITDLAIGSTFLEKINSTNQNIPIFALYGDAGMEVKLVQNGSWFITKNVGEAGCSHAHLFGENMHSDGVVPVNSSSADGKLSADHTQPLGGIIHVGMGQNQTVIDATIPLLTKDKTIFADSI